MALSKENEHILQALIELRDNGPTLENEGFGICMNIQDILDERNVCINAYEFVSDNAINWPKSVGYPKSAVAYPVPHDYKFGLWEGENGKLRYELIDFLIATLVEEDRKP